MTNEHININATVGTYSNAVVAGDTCYLSGVVGVDPTTNKLVAQDAGIQTRQILANIAEILDAAGFTPESVVQYTCYLTDISDWSALNQAFCESVPAPPPARIAVAVRDLPLAARVEISAIAVRPPTTDRK